MRQPPFTLVETLTAVLNRSVEAALASMTPLQRELYAVCVRHGVPRLNALRFVSHLDVVYYCKPPSGDDSS